MPITRFLSRSHIEIGLAYLAGYVLLDWVSYIQPIASLGITPWNPPPGLSLALILLFGRAFLPWLFLAPLARGCGRAAIPAAAVGGACDRADHRRRLRRRRDLC